MSSIFGFPSIKNLPSDGLTCLNNLDSKFIVGGSKTSLKRTYPEVVYPSHVQRALVKSDPLTIYLNYSGVD